MGYLVLQKGEREAAWDKIHKHDAAQAKWIDSPEREATMRGTHENTSLRRTVKL